MVKGRIKQFLQSGELAGVKTGMSREQVQQALGMPDYWGISPSSKTKLMVQSARIWYYAWFDFYFEEDICYAIFSDKIRSKIEGENLELDPWVLQDGISRLDVEKVLLAENLPYRVVAPWYKRSYDDARVSLLFDSGVELSFIDQNHNPFEESTGLFAIGLWNFGVLPAKLPVKTFNFTLSETTYEQIREKSLTLKVKMHRIASDLVKDLIHAVRGGIQETVVKAYIDQAFQEQPKRKKQLTVTVWESEYDVLVETANKLQVTVGALSASFIYHEMKT